MPPSFIPLHPPSSWLCALYFLAACPLNTFPFFFFSFDSPTRLVIRLFSSTSPIVSELTRRFGFIRSTDWHLPSPSSTPKSGAFPDSTFLQTPKPESVPQSHFLDAWSTPGVNGHQTPAQTPSFTFTSPVLERRPSTSYSQRVPTPNDPEFHVNHFAFNNLPLPPVEPSRRLSSSPDPLEAKMRENPPLRPHPLSMNLSQMQTPPPTRDASSRNGLNQQVGGQEFGTPATVIARPQGNGIPPEGVLNQTPFGFPALQFSPDIVQFPSTGPISAPVLPQSRLFWDQNDASQMDLDLPIASDPFGPTTHKIDTNFNWQSFSTATATTQMNAHGFQAQHGLSSPGPISSFANSNAGYDDLSSRPSSLVSPSSGVDPSMLFSFSSPGPASSPDIPRQPVSIKPDIRQPYETQLMDSLREREMAKKTKSQHSRDSTSSSTASFEGSRPGLQRSNTDSGFRKSRPPSMESKPSGPALGISIPRRSSPLKRQSGAQLLSIPEVRRPKTRLVIDETGRARTETVPVNEAAILHEMGRDPSKNIRKEYPGLWAEGDSDSEPEEPLTLSRTNSFNVPPPQRRSSKHARTDKCVLDRSNSFKMLRSASGVFEKSSLETLRPVRRTATDNAYRRLSMMDLPAAFNDTEDQQMPDSPGDALGALKKMVEGRHKRIDRFPQSTLKAHNQRWAHASADMLNINVNVNPHGPLDQGLHVFGASSANTADAGLITPSTDRSSLSSESTRCVCNCADEGGLMVQCESCNKWLHMLCVGFTQQTLPPVYVCVFCTGTTPIARGGRVRGPVPFDSPLTHKSVFRRQ